MGKKKGGQVRIKGPKMPPAVPMMNPMEDFVAPNEMVHLPPPPDRSYSINWPIYEQFDNTEQFQIIYPSYLDSKKTIAKGRRVSLEAAIPTPTVSDVSQALQQLNVKHVIQPYKGYSRDSTTTWDNPGRVLVDVSRFKKSELLLKCAHIIVDLPQRKLRLEQEAAQKVLREQQQRQEEEAAARLEQQKTKTASSSGGGSSSKKKGKKNKRK